MSTHAYAAPVTDRPRSRRVLFLSVGAALAIAIAACLAALSGPLAREIVPSLPFEPSVADGLIPAGSAASLSDDLPAIARLDPGLRDAMRQAEADALDDGIAFEVTSGWRSTEYQRWLFDDAVELYASEEVARQFVATPERSSHVTGHGIDIAPVDAQFWLIQHGAKYGICQTYANERWHFELGTQPGGVCPEMKTDAAQ